MSKPLTNVERLTFNVQRSTWKWAILAGLLLLGMGLGLRLFDLTDQPIDFHPTRQLRSAIIARGMYYRMLPDIDPALRQQAIAAWNSTGQYEPSILEYLVAQTYRVMGGEFPWVARIINSLFWLIGGLALFDLARRAASPSAALVSLGYYLILPFAVQASRSFQPDPGMVMWMILSVNFFYRWSELTEVLFRVERLTFNVQRSTWKWAILAGLCGGIAVFTKFVAAYILAPVAVTMVLYTLRLSTTERLSITAGKAGSVSEVPLRSEVPFRNDPESTARSSTTQRNKTEVRFRLPHFWRQPGWVQPKVWVQVLVMAVLMTTPTLIFYLGRQGRASEYFQDWTISLSHLLIEPSFYVRWLSLVQNLMGLVALLLGLVGVLVAAPRYRVLLLSLWGGYILYGMILPYQMYTHSYYHLQLVPIIALSLAPLAQLILNRLDQEKPVWKFMFAGIVAIGILYPAWVSIATFRSVDYRTEPERWQQIASLLPKDGAIVALTQDYGYPLIYYGQRKVALWPNRGERTLSSLRGSSKEFEEYFAKRTQGKSYFLITAFNQFNDQPDLKNFLAEHYPAVAEGNGYLIYDLETPRKYPSASVQGAP